MKLCACVCAVLGGARAVAQCEPHWSDQFPYPDVHGSVYAATVWDDGTGPALYVGGTFSAAGNVAAVGLAKWDGVKWSAVGPPLSSSSYYSNQVSVGALVVHDDGSGPALFVGGKFTKAGDVPATHLAKWDGHAWTGVTGIADYQGQTYEFPPGVVTALASYDDGGGAGLYVGLKTSITVVSNSKFVARWKGGAWSALGTGVASTMSAVDALETFDDGSGNALYIAGKGVSSQSNIYRWKAGALTTLSGKAGIDGQVWCMRSFDDGSGPALYVGGWFSRATLPSGVSSFDANDIVRWKSTGWSNVGPSYSLLPKSPDGYYGQGVMAIQSFEIEGARKLAIGGSFYGSSSLPGVLNIAAWNGTTFETVGADYSCGSVAALAEYGEGPGRSLVVGAGLQKGAVAFTDFISQWNGAAWSSIQGTYRNGARSVVAAMAVADVGDGPGVIVTSGDVGVAGATLARWDGAAWSPQPEVPQFGPLKRVVVDGRSLVLRLCIWDRAKPETNAVWAFENGSWSIPDGGIKDTPSVQGALAEAAEQYGDDVVVTGRFHIAGGKSVNNGARWDGHEWWALGDGVVYASGALVDVTCAKSMLTASGEVLYVGGKFDRAGGIPVLNIAAWDGENWHAVPTGGVTATTVNALEVFDDGLGPKLYAAGRFTDGGGKVGALARLDDAGWTIVSDPGTGYTLRVFDDGNGAQLYMGWAFGSMNGDARTAGLARWDGVTWTDVGGGLGEGGPSVRTIVAADVGDGPSLFVGGSFLTAGGISSGNFGQWNPCRERCYADYDGDSLVNGVDFNEFVADFVAGAAAADIDHNGFVNGDDFDSFVAAFAAGC